MFYVYQTTCLVNNKIYIGYHQSDDIENDPYLGSGRVLTNAIRKYGRDQFVRVVLFEYASAVEARFKEAELVHAEFVKRTDVYNLAIGGQGGSSVTAFISSATRKANGIKAGEKQRGRTAEKYEYLRIAGEKNSARFKAMSLEERQLFGEKTTHWMNDKRKHLLAIQKTVDKNKGRTKENSEGRRSQAEKMAAHMNNGLAETIAAKLRGRTKENSEGRRSQAEKVAGNLNAAKRPEVRAKLSASLSGSHNPAFGKFGEAGSNAKLTNAERLQIISEFESGTTRKDIYAKYSHIVKAVTLKKLIANREQVKQQLGENNAIS